jgi:hypothetical protein
MGYLYSLKFFEHVLCLSELNSVALVRKRTIPTARPQLVSKINAKYCV